MNCYIDTYGGVNNYVILHVCKQVHAKWMYFFRGIVPRVYKNFLMMLFHKGTQVKNSNLESAMKNTQIDPEINVLEDSRDEVLCTSKV